MPIDIKSLIGAMFGIVVGLALFPVVKDQVDAVNTTGVTGGSLISIIPMIYILIIVGGAVAYVYFASK
jgi:hypothetical protein